MKVFNFVYICRLFGRDRAYDELRQELGENPDFASDAQQESLLRFLNKWGCRIKKDGFPKENLQTWVSNSRLPGTDKDIRSLTDSEREHVAQSYDEALVKIGPRFKDTAAAKTLHAIRPRSLPMWDQKIKDWFLKNHASGETSQCTTGQTYAAFIRHVAGELSTLEADANRLGHSLADIPQLVGKPDYSLVKLVDEYYWMTITSDYTVPTRAELEQWLDLV